MLISKTPLQLSFIYFLVILLFGCSHPYHISQEKSRDREKQDATMRAYKIYGIRYKPTYVKIGQVMHGISSWYGPNFHGKRTSNGERYNMYAPTAAHKTWPMNTMVKVTNLDNGKKTLVRINDRGPFVQGRVIDCSYKAAKDLGLDESGIARVKLEVVGFAGKVLSEETIAKHRKNRTLKQIKLTNFGVQIGAFRRYEGAKTVQQKQSYLDRRHPVVIKKFYGTDGGVIYRVWLMGFGSEDEARAYKTSHALSGAFIVRE